MAGSVKGKTVKGKKSMVKAPLPSWWVKLSQRLAEAGKPWKTKEDVLKRIVEADRAAKALREIELRKGEKVGEQKIGGPSRPEPHTEWRVQEAGERLPTRSRQARHKEQKYKPKPIQQKIVNALIARGVREQDAEFAVAKASWMVELEARESDTKFNQIVERLKDNIEAEKRHPRQSY